MFTHVKCCNYMDFKVFSYNVHIFSNNILIWWRKLGCHTGRDHTEWGNWDTCLLFAGLWWSTRKAVRFLGKGNSSQESLGRMLTNWYLEVMFLNPNKTKAKTNLQAWVSQGTVVTSERSPCNLENIKPKIKAEREPGSRRNMGRASGLSPSWVPMSLPAEVGFLNSSAKPWGWFSDFKLGCFWENIMLCYKLKSQVLPFMLLLGS